MTRDEFIENVQGWYDLRNFCCDENLDICEDVYSEDEKDDFYNDNLVEMARNAGSYSDLIETLNDIPNGYDWYIRDYDYDEFNEADDRDFREYKERVIDQMDDDEAWDEPEEDQSVEEVSNEIEESEAEPLESKDFENFFIQCNEYMCKI